MSLTKLSSWYLLMLLSFVLVTLINDIQRQGVGSRGRYSD